MFLPLAAAGSGGGNESSAFSRIPQQHFLSFFETNNQTLKAPSCSKFDNELIYHKKKKKSTGNSLPC